MGAWIEMHFKAYFSALHPVAPHVGAWIEMHFNHNFVFLVIWVAPHVGAWIEIGRSSTRSTSHSVAPHVGAWIEIFNHNFVS